MVPFKSPHLEVCRITALDAPGPFSGEIVISFWVEITAISKFSQGESPGEMGFSSEMASFSGFTKAYE